MHWDDPSTEPRTDRSRRPDLGTHCDIGTSI